MKNPGHSPDKALILDFDPFREDQDTPEFPIPSDEDCFRLWDVYAVPEHIRVHSLRVGEIAQAMALRAEETGVLPAGDDVQAIKACGLLHDLAKMYTVEHGGNHAQLGAAWVRMETGNPLIAQGVLHHVWWPLDVDPIKHFLPLAVLYADKRVKHENVVSLGARYSDLFERYGKKIGFNREHMKRSMNQSMAIEAIFEELLGVDFNACTFDSGRLVKRT
jgi:putative nucleotidyltransferase with HDIG domain